MDPRAHGGALAPDRMWREDGSCAPSGRSRAAGAGDLLARVEVGSSTATGADDALWWTARPDAAWLWRMVGAGRRNASPRRRPRRGDAVHRRLRRRRLRRRCCGTRRADFAVVAGSLRGEMAFETAEVAEPPRGGYPVGCGGRQAFGHVFEDMSY